MPLNLDRLAASTNRISKELRVAHGDKALTLNDVTPELRDVVKGAVGDAPSFHVKDVERELDEAYAALHDADRAGLPWRDGKNDGVIQPDELARATARKPAASPLYTLIEARTSKSDRAAQSYRQACDTEDALKLHKTPAEAAHLIAEELAPLNEMTGWNAAHRASYLFADPRHAAAQEGYRAIGAHITRMWDVQKKLTDASEAHTPEDRARLVAQGVSVAKDLPVLVDKTGTVSALREQLAGLEAQVMKIVGEHAMGLFFQPYVVVDDADALLKQRAELRATIEDALAVQVRNG